MKIYGLKIYESDVFVKDFRPIATNGVAGLYDLCGNQFYPLPGGEVRGMKFGGVEFQIAPQPATLMPSGVSSTATLTCLAAGAQSYEWYEDGVLMYDKTSDSLTLTWERAKAKSSNHPHPFNGLPGKAMRTHLMRSIYRKNYTLLFFWLPSITRMLKQGC